MSRDQAKKAALLRRCREAIDELARRKNEAADKTEDTPSTPEIPRWDTKFPG